MCAVGEVTGQYWVSSTLFFEGIGSLIELVYTGWAVS